MPGGDGERRSGRKGAGIRRRDALRALALAPAALAGCAAARLPPAEAGTGASAGAPGPGAAPGSPPDAAALAALAAVRAAEVPPRAEPAFVFRAAPARPGERR